jgi:hypothetical protein
VQPVSRRRAADVRAINSPGFFGSLCASSGHSLSTTARISSEIPSMCWKSRPAPSLGLGSRRFRHARPRCGPLDLDRLVILQNAPRRAAQHRHLVLVGRREHTPYNDQPAGFPGACGDRYGCAESCGYSSSTPWARVTGPQAKLKRDITGQGTTQLSFPPPTLAKAAIASSRVAA